MSNESSDHTHRQPVLAENICNLLYSLSSSTYDEIAPKIEYWIEFVLTEPFTTTYDLAERVSSVAWGDRGSKLEIARFFKKLYHAAHRPEQTRSFVDELCLYLLRWFAVASMEDLWKNWSTSPVSKYGGPGFIRAASFVGHLIECGLIRHELVRRYIFKPLMAQHYSKENWSQQATGANAIYQLFDAAGNTLLQGLLEPQDVQACFGRLETRISLGKIGGMDLLDVEKVNEFRKIHAAWLQRKKKEQRNVTTAEKPVGVQTPINSANLPTAIDIGIPSILRGIEPTSVLHAAMSSSDAFTNNRIATTPSPTLSVSTISDLTPTELGDDTGESSDERVFTHHKTFYLEDGNVEIACGHTIFRVHSTVVSFSSSKLRGMLSPLTLLDAPMPEGYPRIVLKDSVNDFAILMKMIYTPGFPARHKVPEFTTFASLLRMATKYGFSDVREQLVEDLKGAYPTKWEDFQTAKVLGEEVFGSPKPHPNAVFNLFLEQNVKFALPFAAYRTSIGGFSALASYEPGAVLPRLTLASIIHGRGEIRRTMTLAAHSVVYTGNLGACAENVCILNVGIGSTERRTEAQKKILDAMLGMIQVNMLSPLSLGTLVCVNCAKRAEKAHLGCRKQLVWARLPSLLGWDSWADT